MVRPLRIEYPGALYHVMSRGNAYRDIYLDNIDRNFFLGNLANCIETYNLVCHAYCLMGNHYHLLIETPEGNLSKAMRDINGIYTQWFNWKNQTIGHLLQGRYKAYVIEKEAYFLAVARYIVNNPIAKNIVRSPDNWEWSNFCATSGIIVPPPWLERNFTLSLFSEEKNEAESQYFNFVCDTRTQLSPYENLKEGIILGSQQILTGSGQILKKLRMSQKSEFPIVWSADLILSDYFKRFHL